MSMVPLIRNSIRSHLIGVRTSNESQVNTTSFSLELESINHLTNEANKFMQGVEQSSINEAVKKRLLAEIEEMLTADIKAGINNN